MGALLKKTLSKSKISLLAYIAICVLLVWMFVAMFPAIQDEAESMSQMLEAYPESMMKMFGLEGGVLFTELESFLTLEYFSLMWPLIIIIMIISFGTGALAGEIDDKTIEVLLAQPISRTKIYLSKYLAGVVLILIFVLVTVFSVIPFAELYGVDYEMPRYFTMAILGGLFGLAVFSMTMLISSIFSSKGVVSALSAGIMLMMYILFLLATLQESLEGLRYFSYFYYFDYREAMMSNAIPAESIWVFLGSILIFTPLGLVIFRRRDVCT